MTFFKALSYIQITTAATSAFIELQSSVAIIILLKIIILLCVMVHTAKCKIMRKTEED